MKKFKALYKAMYDDLKDAEMMIDYACDVEEEHAEDKQLADILAKYAKYRLDHFLEFHKLFKAEAVKHPSPKGTLDGYMWEQSHKHLKEWYEHIKTEIEKY